MIPMEYEQQGKTTLRGGERFLSADMELYEVQEYEKESGVPLHPENEDDYGRTVVLYSYNTGYETHIEYGNLLAWVASMVVEPL